jgi:hypothetical protein
MACPGNDQHGLVVTRIEHHMVDNLTKEMAGI